MLTVGSSRAPLAALLGLLALAGCGSSGTAAQDAPQLNVYNWADYIGKTTIADFERATGIRVNYDTYDADNTLEAKMLAGGTGYDVVTTSTDFFSRQIKAGVYRKLDRSALPNWKYLDPAVLQLFEAADPGNEHAAPYLRANDGFAYNVDLVRARMPDAPVDSLDMLFKPEVIRRFADCGVQFLDQPSDVLMMALSYLGLDPNTKRPEDFKAAEQLVMAVRPYIRSFDSVGYINALVNREICIAMAWSSDYATAVARARAVGVDVHLAYTLPKEGSNRSFDAWLIPADAPHPEAALRFINFMLEPKVIAAVTNDIYYANNNRAADAYVDPRIIADPVLYPSAAAEARMYLSKETDHATERLRTRAWTRIKTGH
jgi:putrescine transport system substrate-binding protein